MKLFFLTVALAAVIGAEMSYAVIWAYPNERCGQIEGWLLEKQKDPELYGGDTPYGLRLTPQLEQDCPGIRARLGS